MRGNKEIRYYLGECDVIMQIFQPEAVPLPGAARMDKQSIVAVVRLPKWHECRVMEHRWRRLSIVVPCCGLCNTEM
jgi:hypothetical protein